MVGLTATGELTYNGYTFDGASSITVDVQFVYDEAGRAIVSHRHLIRVVAVVANDTDLDADVLDLRQKLGAPGKALTFINKGFGDDLVVGTGRVVDTMFGPKPRTLSWTPLGDDKSAEIVWEVEVTLPVCEGTARFIGVSSINYAIEWAIDEHGSTTRTITGFLTVAQKRTAAGAPAATADAFRSAINPAVLTGFTREQRYRVNIDKSRLDFTITDTEIDSPNPFPEGMTLISASHRVSWRRGSGDALRYRNTITATIRPQARLSGKQAWNVFLTLVIQRLQHAKAAGRHVLLEGLEVDESLFGRPHRFSASYRVLSCISDFVEDMGLWKPIGTSWDRWHTSLIDSTFHRRGSAGLSDIAANDVIVDLCQSQGKAVASPNNRQAQRGERKRKARSIRNEMPSAERSWMEFESAVMPSRQCPTVRQSILQLPTADEGGVNINTMPSGDFVLATSGSGDATSDVIQTSGRPRNTVAFAGKAMRAGHKIPRPKVDTIGGKTAHEVKGQFMQRLVGNYFGIPVWAARWLIEYVTPDSPGTVDAPNDIKECVAPKEKKADQPK